MQGTHTSTGVIMHAIDILPTLVSAAHGAGALEALARSRADEGFPLDGIDHWEALSTGAAQGPRTEVLLEADPHSLPLQKQYCGDQHGQGASAHHACWLSFSLSLLHAALYVVLTCTCAQAPALATTPCAATSGS